MVGSKLFNQSVIFSLFVCWFGFCRLFTAKSIFIQTVLFQTIQFSVTAVLMSKTVLFQTTQFSIKNSSILNNSVQLAITLPFQTIQISSLKQSYLMQFSLALVHILVLFDLLIRSYQVLLLWARADMGLRAINWYSAFPKALALPNLTIRLFSVISGSLVVVGYYPSAEKQ